MARDKQDGKAEERLAEDARVDEAHADFPEEKRKNEEREYAENAVTVGGDRLIDEMDDRDEVREGQVYESMLERDDDVGGGRRRVKVLDPDHEGKVLVENLSTRRKSHIEWGRLNPEHGWDRYV